MRTALLRSLVLNSVIPTAPNSKSVGLPRSILKFIRILPSVMGSLPNTLPHYELLDPVVKEFESKSFEMLCCKFHSILNEFSSGISGLK